MKYEIIVGNIGKIWSGDDDKVAREEYRSTRDNPTPRMAGEHIVLCCDGEPLLEDSCKAPGKFYVTVIDPFVSDEPIVYRQCATMREATDFLCSYLGDEFDEQEGRITEAELFAGFGALYAGAAAGKTFCFAFDNEIMTLGVAQ